MQQYRQNANWCEKEHPRDDDGKFSSKSGKNHSFEKQNNPPKCTVSKRDYALLCSARAQKMDKYRREGIPNRDYVFTDKKFVIFKNKSEDLFSIQLVIPIVDNEDIIRIYTEELENGQND